MHFLKFKDIVKDVPLTRKHPKKGHIKIAPNPFAHGSERLAYYGKDVTENKPTEQKHESSTSSKPQVFI